MTSEHTFIPYNFKNVWIFGKIYHIYCYFSLNIVENICIDNVRPVLILREHFSSAIFALNHKNIEH